MGKRKSSRKPQTKVKVELDKAFDCLFCNHTGSVTCKLDNKLKIGSLSCKVCGQSFQASLNNLSHPIDLYSDWIDAAEEAQKASRRAGGTAAGSVNTSSGTLARRQQQQGGRRDDDEESEDEEDRATLRRRALLEDDEEDLPDE